VCDQGKILLLPLNYVCSWHNVPKNSRPIKASVCGPMCASEAHGHKHEKIVQSVVSTRYCSLTFAFMLVTLNVKIKLCLRCKW
jgi:hypothetical protein